MKNELIMKMDMSFSLNFLIYIQNIFFNQNQKDLRFPYLSTRIEFNEDFKLNYKELWNEISQGISNNNKNDLKIFYEEKDLFYQRLFVVDADNLKNFNEICKTFKVWWDSPAGHFSIERSVDEIGYRLYWDLANLLAQKGIEPQKELNISLIYDRCLLGQFEVFQNFIILPIRSFLTKKEGEIVYRLQKLFY
ncbi:hypothetical protein [Pseudogracilibacillus sp. SO30301A]|uniref:hypothetical protein n=1 Tax=Pseudogracilibacillus sp. SO30301A TaxID=3098291 RepID=UPI00300E44F4